MKHIKILLLEDSLAGAGASYIPGGLLLTLHCDESEVKEKAKEIWHHWDSGALDALEDVAIEESISLEELYFNSPVYVHLDQKIENNQVCFDDVAGVRSEAALSVAHPLKFDYKFGSSELTEYIQHEEIN